MAIAREQILEALKKLDVNNDAHWTQDGLPRLETVRLFAGDQSIGRDTITSVASDFTRLAAYNAQQATQSPAAPVAPAAEESQPAAQETQPAEAPAADPAVVQANEVHLHLQPNHEVQQVGNLMHVTPGPAATEAQDSDDAPTLQEQLAEVNDAISEVDGYIAQAKKHRDALVLKRDDLVLAIDKADPKNSNQQDIMSYLESQKKLLENRRERIEATKNINLADFLPKRAPIDVAMARKNTRGGSRPVRK